MAPRASIARLVVDNVLFGALYYAAAKVGHAVAVPPAYEATVWPAAGLALGAVLLRGYGVAPGLFIACFVQNALRHLDVSTSTAAAYTAVNGLANAVGGILISAVGSAWLIRRITGTSDPFVRTGRVKTFFIVSVAAGPLAAACIGVGSLCATGVLPAANFATAALTWWVGDAVGVLIAAPLVVAVGTASAWAPVGTWRFLAGLAAPAVLLCACLGLMLASSELAGSGVTLVLIAVPVLVWIAFRLDRAVLMVGVAVVTGVAAWATSRGMGPFVTGANVSPLLDLQLFNAVIGAMLLLLSAALAERKTMIERIREREAHARELLEMIPHAVFECDAGGRLGSANSTFSRMTGYSVSELAGELLADLLEPGTEHDGLDGHLRRLAVVRPDVTTYAARLRTKWGRPVDVEIDWSLRCSAQGQVTGFVGVLADVTERKRQQEVQRRLEARQQHARRLESLGVFAGGIAHDFNNMLAAIVGFGELARQEVPEDSEAAQYLNDVLQAAARATELVTQVLTFSRSTEGEPRPVALSPLVTESMRFVRATLPASIEFRHEVVRDAGRLIADPTQLQQVILNLCNNAEHAMREHGGLLEVTLQAVALAEGDETGPTQLPPGHYAELTVRDTGCGISPDHLDRIFDPFYTTKELGEGTGLGLSTVHGIVTQCGGAITVESEVGVGTKFRVYLPSSEAEAADGHHRP